MTDATWDRRTTYAWALAMLLSGIPSSLHAWLSGGDVMAATRAAGEMFVAPSAPTAIVLAVAFAVHAGVSLFWTVVLRRLLPMSYVMAWAALAGAAIAVVDLLVVGEMFSSIRGLAFLPQLADHIAFALLALSVPRKA